MADGTLAIGSGLVITEIMQNPSAVSDSLGEWFEVTNTGTEAVNLKGWIIRDNDSDSHVIDADLVVEPGQYVVLGRNADSATNGGVAVDYVYSGFVLANGADEVILESPDGHIIDSVIYDGGATFPDPNGASMALSDPLADNAVGANWAEAETPYGDGDLGTPGEENDVDSVDPVEPGEIAINELRLNASGDERDYVEIIAPAGTSLDGLSLVVVSGEFSPGQVDFVFDLSGTVVDDDGRILIRNADLVDLIPQTDAQDNDVVADFDFFGSPQTFLLIDGFTGAAGDDLDADNDGIAEDLTGVVIDSVSVVDGDATADISYSPTVIGPNGSFTPSGLARDPDSTGGFTELDFGDFSADTPGTENFPPIVATAATIMEIQGARHVSPFVAGVYDDLTFFETVASGGSVSGEFVITTGVVTATDSNGFYLQDPTGDGDIATSDAIFVFTGSAPSVSVGDSVQVQGQVSEFFPGGAGSGNLSTTQLSNATITPIEDLGPLPEPVILGEGGRPLPTQNIDDDAFASFDAASDGIDFYESLEGMLVTASDTVAVSPTNRFGEIYVAVDQGADATGLSERGTLNISPDDFNPEWIQIDVDDNVGDFETPDVNVGDSLGDVTGVVSYSFGAFEILPTMAFADQVVSAGLEQEVTELSGSASDMSVATYNVLNLDPNDDDGDTDVADGRFEAIAQQIVVNLGSPDVIALQEVQDNSGSVDDGTVSASETLALLAAAIEAAGGPSYEVIDNTFIGDNTSGGQPGGNIRTAFLYNPDRVSLVDGSVETIGSQDEGGAFEGARLPLVATFEFNGEEVTVVNNHFSSKGGSSPLYGQEQNFAERQEDVEVNGSLDERQAQSEAVQDFVNASGAENIVVLGDFNEFEFVSPVEDLAANTDLVNLTETLDEDERYSFIFQGNSQSLDHILVSDTLAADAQFDVVHVNAEFAATDSRGSDHDPVVATLFLPDLEELAVSIDSRGRFGAVASEGIDGEDAGTQKLGPVRNGVTFRETGITVDAIDPSGPELVTFYGGQIGVASFGGVKGLGLFKSFSTVEGDEVLEFSIDDDAFGFEFDFGDSTQSGGVVEVSLYDDGELLDAILVGTDSAASVDLGRTDFDTVQLSAVGDAVFTVDEFAFLVLDGDAIA